MPTKKNKETPAEQSARFVAHAQKMVEDGELDPIEADKMLERLVENASNFKSTREE